MSNNSADAFYLHCQQKLENLHANNLWRNKVPRQKINHQNKTNHIYFCNNDYLGLAQDPLFFDVCNKAIIDFGVGSTSAYHIQGYTDIHEELSLEIADWLGFEKSLVVSTGYMANLAICSSLATKNSIILQDKHNHASLIDSARLAHATHGTHMRRYKHHDIQSLTKYLSQTKTKYDWQFVISDGTFSMDGSTVNLEELYKCCNLHKAILMIDDAHSLGVFGPQSGGLSTKYPETKPHILTGTFGKALGGFGAFIAADESIIEVFNQMARPYLFTTALPPALAAHSLAIIRYIRNNPERSLSLQKNINYFKQVFKEKFDKNPISDFDLQPSNTAIQSIIIGDNATAQKYHQRLKKNGIDVGLIRPPTVPINSARLRITLSAAHSNNDIDKLINCLWLEKSLTKHYV